MILGAKENITFKVAGREDEAIIFSWLAESHMMAFWDNSQKHKDDISNFIHGRKQDYFGGKTQYFIASLDRDPFAFILADSVERVEEMDVLHREHMSPSGRTITVDFGIGKPAYLGKGLAASTLKSFVDFYQREVDLTADNFFIDPSIQNERACKAYKRAGFSPVGEFTPETGNFAGIVHRLMVKRVEAN